jgi:hypothetical protein
MWTAAARSTGDCASSNKAACVDACSNESYAEGTASSPTPTNTSASAPSSARHVRFTCFILIGIHCRFCICKTPLLQKKNCGNVGVRMPLATEERLQVQCWIWKEDLR